MASAKPTTRARRTRHPSRAAATMPGFAPQLATLVAAAPDSDEWLHEVKYDGFRMGLLIDKGGARLLTRNGLDWSGRFPELVDAARRLQVSSAILDGEVALELPDGRTSFQDLQNATRRQGALTYFLFDIHWLDGEDLTRLPLEERKARLERLLAARKASPFRYSTHVTGDGARVHAEACRGGLEGIISKRRDAPVTPGRSRAWVKVKCVGRQEFVIGGFTDPQGAREGLGALHIGHHQDGRLVWAGKVGTGFTGRSARELRARLEPLVRETSPFTPVPRGVGRAHWVRPELVAEVAFTEWTEGGKIRHPSFQGLREDKPAGSVVRERAADAGASVSSPVGAARPAAARLARRATNNGQPTSGNRRPAAGKAAPVIIRGVAISNPQREMFPGEGITKLDLVRYVDTVADWMLPHVAGRPLSLVFCPEGIGGECAYLKHGKTWGPKALRRVKIREKTKTGEYMVADTVEGLVAIMQMNWLEMHTWNSRADRVAHPDRLVFDLDPGPDVPWKDIVEAARETRAVLADAGLESWLKTTGGRGLHVVAPLAMRSWREGLAFAEGIAASLVAASPRRYTTAFSKAGREALILVDVRRNVRGSTSIAAYSPRARAGAPVSTPLSWDELSARRRPDRFTVRTVPGRLARLGADPWQHYWTCRQRLPAR